MRKERHFRKEFFEPDAGDTEQKFLERKKSQYVINFTYEILRHGVVLF